MKGFINLNKPLGMTSNDAVVIARGILKSAALDKKLKVGHLGTLDPLATGVLPIAVGSATRLFDLFLNKKKTYVATFKFGETTDTLDRGGIITRREEDILLDDSAIRSACEAFIGEIEQIPPQYSAKSVGGKRAYDLARAGKTVDLPPKKITVYSIDRLNLENLSPNEYAFNIVCSSGTYIRALARDIAAKLGTVGYMTSLIRTNSGPFAIEDSVEFNKFQADPLKYLIPTDFALGDLKALELDAKQSKMALNGVPVRVGCGDGICKIMFENRLLGIGVVRNDCLKMEIRL